MSVAGTYAEALFEAARDKDWIGPVSADLGDLLSALSDTPELRKVLESPEIDTAAKKSAMADILAGANPLVSGFVQLLLDRGRIHELPVIADAFAARVADEENRVLVEVVTAVPLSDDLREQVRAKVKDQTGRDPDITEVVDPAIIGGLVLRVGEVVVDGSVRSRLAEMRRSLETAPVDLAPAAG